MSDISTEDLKTEINEILKDADLSVLSVKKVREQLEKKLQCKLLSRKGEIDSIVMQLINEKNEQDGGDDDEEDASAVSEEQASSEEEKSSKKRAAKKRPQPRKAAPPKKKKKAANASDSGSESDDGADSDYEVPKNPPKKKKAAGGGEGTARKGNGFTRALKLSPELSQLMGAEELPRHEVVKKVWALIKERNLYDPKNKQFAYCDDELLKVMKVKRFRTFGMLKHLKPHFLN